MAKERGAKSEAIRGFLAKNPKANPQQVVDGLKAEGVDVSFGLARSVKYSKKGKKRSAKRGRKATVTVASEQVVTGSDSIRDYIARYPSAKPREIEAGLKSEGIKVSKSLVNAVKYG